MRVNTTLNLEFGLRRTIILQCFEYKKEMAMKVEDLVAKPKECVCVWGGGGHCGLIPNKAAQH